MDQTARQALEIGRANAREVIAFRTKALRLRSQAIARRSATGPAGVETAVPQPALPETLIASAGSAGVLIAEGDSWFNYPWTDILRLLEDEHGYDVESAAHFGDTAEQMAYNGGQLERFSRLLEKQLRRGRVPTAILLSAGGNDLIGMDLRTEFGMLLNHASSPAAGINEQMVSGLIDQRVRLAYITILSAITEVCRAWIQRPLPVLIHGYDYAVPDGRGFLGGWAVLPGPWLEPGFREKGFLQMQERKTMIRELVDHFNTMLSNVTALPEFSHVIHVDLRGTLSTGRDYKKYWDNELHPTARGFRLVTDRFVKILDGIQ